MQRAIKLSSIKDSLVGDIIRKLHPYDLGKETSEIEEIVYSSLERFIEEDSNVLKYSLKK